MMNVVALCLVVTSLATAGVWSPTPEKNNPKDQEVIVKEGHRVIVVEYEKEGLGNTKVSISPQEDQPSDHKRVVDIDDRNALSDAASSASGVVEKAKEKIKEVSSVLPNLGQGLSSSSKPPPDSKGNGPREIICDAFGKCKQKIAGAFSREKEKASEEVHDVEQEAKVAVEAVSDTFGKAKETVSQKAHDFKEGAKETVDDAKVAVKTTLDRSKTIGKDATRNASEKAQEAKETAEKANEKVKTGANNIKEESQKDLTEIFQRGWDVAYDALTYLVSPHAVGAMMGVVHLLGFAMAYGMAVWITFVSSYVLAGALPRQQFGIVQSKIYPVYFRAMAYCIGLALLGNVLGQGRKLFTRKGEILQGYNLVVSILMVFANMMYLEPRATKVMFERMKMEKEEGRGRDGLIAEPSRVVEPLSVTTAAAATTTTGMATATPLVAPSAAEIKEQEMVKSRIVTLNERLKRLNSYSSFLNILTLMALTWHLVYLAQRLCTSC